MSEERDRLDLGIEDSDEIEIIMDHDDDLPPSIGPSTEPESSVVDDDSIGAVVADEPSVPDEDHDLRREFDELRELYLRKLAEFDNFRKRTEREREELQRTAGEKVVLDLIPVLDNFERALQHGSTAPDPFHQGVSMIYKQLWEALQSEGLERMDPQGEPFEPELHEAVQRIEGTGVAPGTVVSVMAKGYLFGGKLVRPAMVAVAVESSASDVEPETE